MTRILTSLTSLLTGRWTARIVVLLGVLLGVGFIAAAGTARVDNGPTVGLPSSAQSTTVERLLQQLPSGQVDPALVVYSHPGARLSRSDLAAIDQQRPALGELAVGGKVDAALVSQDERVALLTVPLRSDIDEASLDSTVKRIRSLTQDDLPRGVRAQTTGGPGFAADLNDAFGGANTTLLLATGAIVALLLLITYRSPVLWLVPLITVAIADQTTSGVLSVLSRHTGLTIDGGTSGIVEVLVFGAGTDYALLLITRYREELREHDDRRAAMRSALRAAIPPIVASAGTVVLALLTLVFASFGTNQDTGIAAAIGIGVASLFGLLVLPAALVSLPRGIFWPYVPRADEKGRRANAETGKVWRRIGETTARRPWLVILGSVLLLLVFAAGLSSTSLGLSQSDAVRTRSEAVDGLATLSASFPAGAASPITVITSTATKNPVLSAVKRVDGVVAATVSGRTDRLTEITVTSSAAPDTPASYRTVRDLRSAVAAVPDADAAVGGSVAIDLDTRDASIHDLLLLTPLILGVILIVLLLLLRAVVAPVVLVLSLVLTYLGALGAAGFLFTHLFGYPGLDNQIPLFAFVFLTSLGVDYNIFLITRAREETELVGTRRGIINALAVTGGVITSAGLVLAAVFAVLGVLPVTLLTELGVIVGLGVLIDTLLVRTVLVPALVHVLNDSFWAPGRLARSTAPPRTVRGPRSGSTTSYPPGSRRQQR